MTRILIVDDGTCVRESLAMIITGGFTIAGEAKTGSEAIKLYKEINPDILAVNLEIPQLNGLNLIKKIQKLASKSEVIILSDKSGQENIHEALKAGAVAYIIKPAGSCEFNIAIINNVKNVT